MRKERKNSGLVIVNLKKNLGKYAFVLKRRYVVISCSNFLVSTKQCHLMLLLFANEHHWKTKNSKSHDTYVNSNFHALFLFSCTRFLPACSSSHSNYIFCFLSGCVFGCSDSLIKRKCIL